MQNEKRAKILRLMFPALLVVLDPKKHFFSIRFLVVDEAIGCKGTRTHAAPNVSAISLLCFYYALLVCVKTPTGSLVYLRSHLFASEPQQVPYSAAHVSCKEEQNKANSFLRPERVVLPITGADVFCSLKVFGFIWIHGRRDRQHEQQCEEAWILLYPGRAAVLFEVTREV